MTLPPDTIFALCNKIAAVAWLVLLVTPKRWSWLLAITGWVIPGFFALLYAGLILPGMGQSDGGFGSIEQVRLLFANDASLSAGWLHYLAFDLAVGTFIAKRADEIGLSRIIQVPILLLTFMLGPIGFVLFLLTSLLWTQWRKRRGLLA